MRAAVGAGALYFALVLVVGFVLGTIRTLAVAPRLGEAGAVAIEVPIMLAISWVACRWLVRRRSVPQELSPRLAMGAVAFVLLLVAEAALAVLGFGRTVSEYAASYGTAPVIIGLAGQVGFALIPAIQLHLPPGRADA